MPAVMSVQNKRAEHKFRSLLQLFLISRGADQESRAGLLSAPNFFFFFFLPS